MSSTKTLLVVALVIDGKDQFVCHCIKEIKSRQEKTRVSSGRDFSPQTETKYLIAAVG